MRSAPARAEPRPLPGACEVHLWRVPLDWPAAVRQALRETLDDAERARADRFRFPAHRHRWSAARAALRDILAGYAGGRAHALRFETGPHGKPRLAHPAPGALRFNLSRSGPLALVAVAHGREVGVDVEELRPVPDAEAVASHFFPAAERDALLAVPPEARDAAFLRCWARREAALKRAGTGLALSLDVPEDALAEVAGVDVGAGYVAAVAAEGGAGTIRPFDWAPA